MNASEMYPKYQKMIWNRAHSFARRFPSIDADEFFSEGNLVFMEALQKWDDARGAKFGTYLYTALNNRFSDLARQLSDGLVVQTDEDGRETPSALDNLADESDFLRALEFSDSLHNLTGVTALVIEAALNTNSDDCARNIRGEIVRTLRDKGYSWPVIWRGMREAKELIRR